MGGLQANSGGVSRARVLPLAQVRDLAAAWRAIMLRDNRDCSKNRHPEAVVVSFFNLPEAASASGSAHRVGKIGPVDRSEVSKP
jgi:hypothetical protein